MGTSLGRLYVLDDWDYHISGDWQGHPAPVTSLGVSELMPKRRATPLEKGDEDPQTHGDPGAPERVVLISGDADGLSREWALPGTWPGGYTPYSYDIMIDALREPPSPQ